MSAKLFDHCVKAYAIMEAQAETGGDSGVKFAYIRGIDLVVRDLELSQSYYTLIFRTLTEMGCIEQLERGAASKPSLYKLNYPPEEGKFLDLKNEGKVAGLGNGNPQYIAQNLADVRKRLTAMEADVSTLKQVMAFFSTSLTEANEKIKTLEAGSNDERS